MSTEEHTNTMQLLELFVINGNESHRTQTFTLHAIVYDVAQAIKRSPLLQFLLSLAYGRGHTEAKSRTFVNLNANHLCIFMVDKWS